jgi:hypothetical protein
MDSRSSIDNNKDALSYSEIEPTEKFGPGKLYKIGAMQVEVYDALPDNRPSLARIRAPGASMAIYHVLDVRMSQDGGMLIDFGLVGEKVHASLSINRAGDIAFVYSPPVSMGISENGKTRTVRGIEYNQSTIDIPRTAEGIRVEIRGTVDAAPRPVVSNMRNSPLMFFLIEENPKEPQKPVYHEVWAVKAARGELQRAKLIKGSVIEAVLYRKVLDLTTIGGEKETVTRNYLARLIYVSKKPKG